MPTLKLPVKLTEADRLVMQGDLSGALKANEEVKAAKKKAMSSFTAAIKDHDDTIHNLNENLLAGVVYREVEVRIDKDLAAGTAKTIRLDTGEEVVSKDIDPDERQIHFDEKLAEARAAEAAGKTTEEQVLATSPEEAEQLREQRLAAEGAERAAEERREAWLKLVSRKIIVLPILDAEEGADGFKASIGQVPGYPWTVLEATGESETEAKDMVRDQLVAQWKLAEEKAEHARKDRILEKLGALLKEVTFETVPDDDSPYVVAKLVTEKWVTEADGQTHEAAAAALRAKLIAMLEDEEAEIAKLAAEQAYDRAKDGPRHKLKAPPGAKKRKGKGISVEVNGKTLSDEELEAATEQKPPADGEPPPPSDADDPGKPDGLAF